MGKGMEKRILKDAGINSKFLAKRIGMNESLLSQYVTGKKKPSAAQITKILNGIQEIGRELSNINLFSR